jgi:hypothetical protein
MRYLEAIFGTYLGRLLAIGSIRKAMWYGIGVGAVAGVTLALAKGHWALILVGCGIGLTLGISVGLVVRGVSIMRRRDESLESERLSEEERK